METNVNKIPYLDTEIEIIQWLSESDAQYKKRLEYIKKLEKVKTEVLPQQVRGSSKQTTRGAKNPSTSQSGPSR